MRLLAKWQPSSPIRYDMIAVHIDLSEVWDGAAEQMVEVESLLQSLHIEMRTAVPTVQSLNGLMSARKVTPEAQRNLISIGWSSVPRAA